MAVLAMVLASPLHLWLAHGHGHPPAATVAAFVGPVAPVEFVASDHHGCSHHSCSHGVAPDEVSVPGPDSDGGAPCDHEAGECDVCTLLAAQFTFSIVPAVDHPALGNDSIVRLEAGTTRDVWGPCAPSSRGPPSVA